MAARTLVTGEFYGERQRQQRCGGIVLSELKHRRKKSLPEHTHEAAFISVMLSGRYREVFGSRRIDYSPMTAVIHPPAFTHHDFIGGSGGHFLIAELSTAWLGSVRELCPVLSLEPGLLCGEAARLAQRLTLEYRRADAWSALMIEGIVLEILAAACRVHSTRERSSPEWMPRVRELLHEHFSEHLTIQQIARELQVDPIYLGRTYKRFAGESLGQARNRRRLEFVCLELVHAEHSLTDIALAAGFSDQSHMTREFRRAYGVTPGAYRRRD
jgi:AraC family transcriptional regulator